MFTCQALTDVKSSQSGYFSVGMESLYRYYLIIILCDNKKTLLCRYVLELGTPNCESRRPGVRVECRVRFRSFIDVQSVVDEFCFDLK